MKHGENQTLYGVMERKCRMVNRLGLLSLILLMVGTVSFINAADAPFADSAPVGIFQMLD